MASKPAAAAPMGIVSVVARMKNGLAAVLWGLFVGLLFVLAFPLAIVLAPLLWAFGKLRGGSAECAAEADLA